MIAANLTFGARRNTALHELARIRARPVWGTVVWTGQIRRRLFAVVPAVITAALIRRARCGATCNPYPPIARRAGVLDPCITAGIERRGVCNVRVRADMSCVGRSCRSAGSVDAAMVLTEMTAVGVGGAGDLASARSRMVATQAGAFRTAGRALSQVIARGAARALTSADAAHTGEAFATAASASAQEMSLTAARSAPAMARTACGHNGPQRQHSKAARRT
jgi:hypothetical protein